MSVELVYTELYHDNCQRANENPLDPTNWLERTATGSDGDVLQLLNHEICTTQAFPDGGDGTARYLPTLPNDQYAEVTIGNLITNETGFINIYIRAGSLGDPELLPFWTVGFFNQDANTGNYDIWQVSNTSTIPYDAAVSAGTPDGFLCPLFIPGEKITIAVLGSYATGSVYLSRNGAVIFSVQQNVSPYSIQSGGAGLQIAVVPVSGNVDASITRWAAGSVQVSNVYSVPDSRVAPFGPNASRNVNGTLIYDVQTSSNPAISPKDSRVAGAPVASGTYPQNSRTPGTYGPGE